MSISTIITAIILYLNTRYLRLYVAVNPAYTVLFTVLLMFSLQAEQIAEYDRDSADNQTKYQSKYGTKSCNYVSSSEKVDDIKVPVKTVESNALDELLDSVVSPSSHEVQVPVKTVESNALDELLDSVVSLSSHEVQDISNHSVTEKSQEGKVIDLEEDLNDLLSSGNCNILLKIWIISLEMPKLLDLTNFFCH